MNPKLPQTLDISDYCNLFALSQQELQDSHVLEYGRSAKFGHEHLTQPADGFVMYDAQEKIETNPLPFKDFTFDFALSAYCLFSQVNVDTLFATITELARVAKEVRIYPIMNDSGDVSPFLGPILLKLQENNFGVEIREVTNLNQPQNKAMLRVWAQCCPVSSS